MSEPTPDIIVVALGLARDLLKRNRDWDLLRALAEATTSAQSSGIEGFKVFRDTRLAVAAVLPAGGDRYAQVAAFSSSADHKSAVAVLDKAIKEAQ
jgi:hypothetical protein